MLSLVVVLEFLDNLLCVRCPSFCCLDLLLNCHSFELVLLTQCRKMRLIALISLGRLVIEALNLCCVRLSAKLDCGDAFVNLCPGK
jgi:hypothetical protein